MSFEQLMGHANEIQQKARRRAMERLGIEQTEPGQPAPTPVPNEGYERQRIDRAFADVPEQFQPFAEMPDPSSFNGMIENMAQALRILSTGQDPKDPIGGEIYDGNVHLDKMSGTESYIEDWVGKAAMEFKANFIDPFPTIVRNQFIIASVLKAALEAQREIWVTARTDIDKIAHDTLEALDCMDECGPNDWNMMFTVVGAVASVAAVPLTGGTSVAVAAVAAGSSVAAARAGMATEPLPTIRFAGETAEVVIAQMREAISVLVGHIQEQEAKIADALANTHGKVAGDRASFVCRRPALAHATERDITGSLGMGYSR